MTKRIEGFDDAKDLLQQWGYWVRSGAGIPRYTSPMYALMRDMVGSSVPTALIEDRTAMLVDGAVARLDQRDRASAEALFLYYPVGLTIHDISRRWRCSRPVVSSAIDRGIVWVEAVIFDGEEVA
jgi:hypothetical protein